MYLASLLARSSLSCFGVRPAACTSSSSGSEILPSGRTGTVRLIPALFHTVTSRRSSGPIVYPLVGTGGAARGRPGPSINANTATPATRRPPPPPPSPSPPSSEPPGETDVATESPALFPLQQWYGSMRAGRRSTPIVPGTPENFRNSRVRFLGAFGPTVRTPSSVGRSGLAQRLGFPAYGTRRYDTRPGAPSAADQRT